VRSILYLGCAPAERAVTEKILAASDLSIIWADNPSHALSELQRSEMPVVIDLARGAAALQAARDLRTKHPNVLLLAVVDERRPDLTTEAVLIGVADVFPRPPTGRRLASAIERERNYESRQPARKPQAAAEALYSHSPSMREVVAGISRAATRRTGVIIRGEEGTGRQVVARAIHAIERATAPFVSVDCGAHDSDEIDAFLFGHNGKPRGGNHAAAERISRHSCIHDALGGSLYLRNVTEAPTRSQVKLGRLLRDGEATFTESGSAVKFDVRVMAGVDSDVDDAVNDGRLRPELFKRLSATRIDVPPLRHRREDIPALANYFLREICGSRRIPPKSLSRPALSLIAALPWRGNAVELQQMLESIVSELAGGKGIGIEDVLAHLRLDIGSVSFEKGGTLQQVRARFESEYIAHVLERHHGRVSEAANTLGIRRTNLYRKIRSLRLKVDGRR
jgi:DNA-binding NtrC family response regulator